MPTSCFRPIGLEAPRVVVEGIYLYLPFLVKLARDRKHEFWSVKSKGNGTPISQGNFKVGEILFHLTRTLFFPLKNQPKNVGKYRAYIYHTWYGRVFCSFGEGGLRKLRRCFFFEVCHMFFCCLRFCLGKTCQIMIFINIRINI